LLGAVPGQLGTEPVYNANTQTLLWEDNCNYPNFAAAVAGGWTVWADNPDGPTNQDVSSDAAGSNLIVADGPTGLNALRLKYYAVANSADEQEIHIWDKLNTFGGDTNAGKYGNALYLEFWARVSGHDGHGVDDSQTWYTKVKWLYLTFNSGTDFQASHSYTTRGHSYAVLPYSTLHTMLPDRNNISGTTYAGQIRAPFERDTDNAWSKFTYKYMCKSGASELDGICQLWKGGTLICSITPAHVDVVVPGNYPEDGTTWCTEGELGTVRYNDYFTGFRLGSISTKLRGNQMDFALAKAWRD